MATKFAIIMKYFLLLTFLTVVFSNCSKRSLPTSMSGQPVFSFSGTINNQPVTYTAGDSGLYMFTEYFKDNQDLITLKGYFAPHNCTTCEPYLSFEFKDENPNIETSLYSDIFSFFERSYFTSVSFDSIEINSPTETFKFSADNNPPGTTYHWNFGDGDTSNLASPIHTFTTDGIKDVRLITKFNNLRDTIIIPIEVTPFSECRNRFSVNVDSLNSITANAEGLFNSYLWNFGDGGMGEGSSVKHTYTQNGLYEIILSTSYSGCLATYKRKVNLTGNSQIPVSNFFYSTFVSSETKTIARINHSACIITLKMNGKTYKSYKNNPSLDQSDHKIISTSNIGAYENNAQGQKTIKLDGEIDLFLYNIANNNDSIPIKSNKLTIAIGLP